MLFLANHICIGSFYPGLMSLSAAWPKEMKQVKLSPDTHTICLRAKNRSTGEMLSIKLLHRSMARSFKKLHPTDFPSMLNESIRIEHQMPCDCSVAGFALCSCILRLSSTMMRGLPRIKDPYSPTGDDSLKCVFISVITQSNFLADTFTSTRGLIHCGAVLL